MLMGRRVPFDAPTASSTTTSLAVADCRNCETLTAAVDSRLAARPLPSAPSSSFCLNLGSFLRWSFCWEAAFVEPASACKHGSHSFSIWLLHLREIKIK